MAVILPTTFESIIELLEELEKKTEEILLAINLPEGDVRCWSIVEIRTLCNTIGYVPLILCYAYENAIPQRRVEMGMMLGVTDEKQLVQGLLDPFTIRAKASFVTMAQFSLENAVAKMLEAIGATPEENFSRNISKIIYLTSIPQAQDKLKKLSIPASLRNTMHRDGYHTKADESIVIGEITYDFIKNQQVQCASWGHIYYMYIHVLDIYKEIFLSQKISEIKLIPR